MPLHILEEEGRHRGCYRAACRLGWGISHTGKAAPSGSDDVSGVAGPNIFQVMSYKECRHHKCTGTAWVSLHLCDYNSLLMDSTVYTVFKLISSYNVS